MIPFEFQDSEVSTPERLWRRVRDTLKSLKQAVTNEHLLTVTFPGASTDVSVRHGLRGPVQTWEVVDKATTVDVWRVSGDRELVTFQASGAAAVVIRVT